jgi:hypothetical protein
MRFSNFPQESSTKKHFMSNRSHFVSTEKPLAETIGLTIADIARAALWRRAFDAGMARAKAERIAEREPTTWLIREEFNKDFVRGLPVWGRATRIAKKTRLPLRTVTRVVALLNKISLDHVQAE